MANAYKNNNDTLMTWDIFQHQEQRMMRSNAGHEVRTDEYRTQGLAQVQSQVQSGTHPNANR